MQAIPLAAQPDSYAAILRYLRPPQPSPSTLWWMIAAVVAAGLSFAILELVSSRIRRERARRKSRDSFSRLAAICQLAPEEIKRLQELVHAAGMQYPDRLFVSFECFNTCIEDLGPGAGGPLRDSDVQALRIIRNKVFFGERSKLPPVKSTRELKVNQWLHLKRHSDGKVFMAPVIEAGTSGLLVVTPSVSGKYLEAAPGEKFDIFFWRDRDASYKLESEVIGQSGGRLLITTFRHVDDIERAQRREYHRVETSIPVVAVPVARNGAGREGPQKVDWERPGLQGYVVNLSGAGFAFVAPLPFQPNDLVYLELPVDDDNSLPLMAKILGVHRREATGEFIMNAEFVGMSPDAHERVFRLIYSYAGHTLSPSVQQTP